MDDDAKQMRALTRLALRIAADLSATIAVPMSVLMWLGRRADAVWETGPKFLAAGILLSFIITTVSICHKALFYDEKYKRLTGIERGPPGEDEPDG